MPTKTQKKNRAKLVAALRSGKYEQDNGYLHTDKGFCCQGVACDIFKKETKGKWETANVGLSVVNRFLVDGKRDIGRDDIKWPKTISNELLGFSTQDSDEFIRMNDGVSYGQWPGGPDAPYTLGEQCTFEEIADCMELLTLAGL